MEITTEVIDHKCPNCDAVLKFHPEIGKWKCEYCLSTFTLEQLKEKGNASNDEKNRSLESEKVDNYNDYMVYNCPDCGAEIITDEQTTATFCVYCGNTAILRNKLSGEFMPNKIIPFKKEKNDAIFAFKSLTKGRPLVPKNFTDEKNIEKIRGIYIPFWFHSFMIQGCLEFKANKYEHWSRGNTDYTRTSIYNIVKEGSASFNSVPIDGSTRFPNDLMNTIQPYDYNELVTYNHAYLSGFLAERYDVASNDTKNELEKSVIENTKNLFINSAGGYTPTHITNNTLKTENYSIEYVLLPVYMVNVKYMNKMYTFAMNGQTGEFVGNIPVDKKKAVKIAIILFISIFLILLIVTYLYYLMGGSK